MQLNGSQIFVEVLCEQGVDTLFGYPGGAVLNLYDELYKNADRITHVLTAHEQGASHAADGYARSTGKVGVCFATSGPGATNLTTGIAVAHGRGVLLCAAERCGIPLFEYTPGQVKMAVTGYGKAEKRQVMDMTKRLLKLAKTPRPDDADALALALCHARSSTSRLPQIKPEKETV